MVDKLITLKEAAEHLGLSEEELNRLVEKGEIPAYQIGGMYLRFKEEQILSLSQRYGPRQTAAPKKGKDYYAGGGARLEAMRDFIYFNDFYIFSGILILILVYIILKSITIP